ncbi:tyrosine recombinase XerC [Robbsia betulipollinis]|uniref:tyrosine recombinase XerC n=1 Tax=Robbsia betulipollinis TaxID=2981849 RepID=UPI003D7B543C
MQASANASGTAAATPPDAARIDAYLTMLANERRYSPHTLRGYRHALDELAALAGARALASLTVVDIRGAVSRTHSQGLGGRSIAHLLSVWRGFFRWFALEGGLDANPVDAVRAPKRAKTLPKALSADDATALMEAATGQDDTALRDRAMLELFYSSGLRLAELVGLDAHYTDAAGYRSEGWIDLDSADVTVTGKGGRRRAVPIGSKAVAALRAWLAVRPAWVRADPHPLFLSVRGARMSPSVVRLTVKRLAREAGIPANVHPHVLRHSFATHVLQSSGDLRAVQEMLGHASVAATQVYTSLDFQYLSKIYDAAHPRAKKK